MAVVINGTTGIDTVQPLNQTVTATGKLGIGVTSPTGKVHIKNDSAVATNAQTAYDNASLRLDNLNTGSSVGLSFGLLGANTNYIQGGYNEGTVAPIALNPYGGGVAIGGTAAANTMDEYEEGTWTPVVADAGTGGNTGGFAGYSPSGTYTKVGRMVYVTCILNQVTTTGMTGSNSLYIRGLPFTVGKTALGSYSTYRVSRNADTVDSGVRAASSGVAVSFPYYVANSATTDRATLVSDVISNTSSVDFTISYQV